MKIRKNFSLKKNTAMRLGGKTRYYAAVKSEADLLKALRFAKAQNLPWYTVGECTNLIVSDAGFRGLIIQNQIKKQQTKSHKALSGAGDNLYLFIKRLNRLGLAGMEKMAGIPGTVGGAIYGCAGAYGQEIKDHLVKVKFFDGGKIKVFSKKECRFGYRDSIFKKHKNWVILEAEFRLKAGKRAKLEAISSQILKLRLKKYPKGLKCPGSFFKNIKLEDLTPAKLRQKFIQKIPPGKIMYGKIPTGFLLDTVGAKGMEIGGIRVALHHGNLIYNAGRGRAAAVKKLAMRLKALVKKVFLIKIEEEVQYLGKF